MSTFLRDLTFDDIPSSMELSTVAVWNQTPEDWSRILRLSPSGCRCVEAAEKVAATTTLVAYGTDLAWVGMVLTRPEHRRKGFTRRLMEDAIARAEGDGIRTLKLDATEEGRPLYESLGFIVEGEIERWGRDQSAPGSNERTLNADSLTIQRDQLGREMPNHLLELDVEAFGASRELVLRELSRSGGDLSTRGYVLSRPGRMARFIGPCVASSEDVARHLLAAHLAAHESAAGNFQIPWCWDLLRSNAGAIRCATDFGFTRRRSLWRMRRGKPIKNNDAKVFATAGFELG